MGLPGAIWHWLSTKAWLDWLCLFLIINPYFLCYYGYDSIGSIMDETGTLTGYLFSLLTPFDFCIRRYKEAVFLTLPNFSSTEKLFDTDKAGIGLLYASTFSSIFCILF